jgi:hypothetical protein
MVYGSYSSVFSCWWPTVNYPAAIAWLSWPGRLAVDVYFRRLPACLLGLLTLHYLTNRPEDARWLTPDEKSTFSRLMQAELNVTIKMSISVLCSKTSPSGS